MRRIAGGVAGLVALLVGVAACGDEDPTGVGTELIGEGVRTVEVFLDAPAFLQADTTFDNIGNLYSKPFRVIASDFGGALDAHTLVRLNRPITVAYVDTSNVSRTDTIASYRDARLTLIVDTLATTAGPIDLEVLDVTEAWDPPAATWTTRMDTAGTPETWTTPGGTTGQVRGTATWTGGDTLVITMDSAAAAVWNDSLTARNGALIRSTTPGALLRVDQIVFDWDVLPRDDTNPPQEDTTFFAGSASAAATLVNPPPPPAAITELRVGGSPSWRSVLNFRDIEDVVVPCDATGACTVLLRDAVINLATLVLTPLPAGPHRAERPVRLEGRAVLRAEDVELSRSPLSTSIGRMADSIDVSIFDAPPPGARVEVPITGYIRQLVQPGPNQQLLPWLAIVATGEGAVRAATLGYTRFGSLESATPPRIRLVITVPVTETP